MARDPSVSERIAVVGLGFGDEGKGSVVDALARQLGAFAVVRFNGGPQAAHHVVSPELRTHCFSQFGSAFFASNFVRSFSTHRVLVEPLSLLREASALESLGIPSPLSRLSLHEQCVVITPFHRLMNRAVEVARGQGRHGSCGLGVGQTFMDAQNLSVPTVRMVELRDLSRLRKKLELIRWMKLDLVEQLQDNCPDTNLSPELRELRRNDITDVTLEGYATLLQQIHCYAGKLSEKYNGSSKCNGVVLFEGAQGVLLDQDHGFWPHVTPSTTTFSWAEESCMENIYKLGVLRAFSTRHGAGPFVAEYQDDSLLWGEHNGANDWQGRFRVGGFDRIMARYALAVVGGVDGLAITCLDRLKTSSVIEWVSSWEYQGDPSEVKDLFQMEGARVLEIQANPAPDRVRQERLTQALAKCIPLREALPDEGALLSRIEAELHVPVVLQSWGPTASDKCGPVLQRRF